MGKQKNKRKNQYREDQYDKKPEFTYTERNDGKKNDHPHDDMRKESGKPPRENNTEYHPVAVLLRDEMIRQITNFLETKPVTQESMDELFNLGSYPARLEGCEGAEDYEVFQLDRSVRQNREDPSKLNRLSTILVVLNLITHKPAFLVQAFISPNRSARVIVHEQGDNGTIYRNTLRWGND